MDEQIIQTTEEAESENEISLETLSEPKRERWLYKPFKLADAT